MACSGAQYSSLVPSRTRETGRDYRYSGLRIRSPATPNYSSASALILFCVSRDVALLAKPELLPDYLIIVTILSNYC